MADSSVACVCVCARSLSFMPILLSYEHWVVLCIRKDGKELTILFGSVALKSDSNQVSLHVCEFDVCTDNYYYSSIEHLSFLQKKLRQDKCRRMKFEM